jgi:hypothetical protein
MGAFFYVLIRAGWPPGAATGPGSPHHAYLQATTMTFLSMVVAQIGTAFAARTERASLRSVGPFSNPLLLAGIAAELALAAAIIYIPPLQDLLGTAALPPQLLLITVPFPFIVWGADEIRRYLLRRHDSRRQASSARPSPHRTPGRTLTMTGVGRDDGEFAVPAWAAEEAEDLPPEVGDAAEDARHRYRDAAVADLDGPHDEQVCVDHASSAFWDRKGTKDPRF